MKSNVHGLRANLYIRWLNAYRTAMCGDHIATTFEQIEFEISRPNGDEVACEPQWYGKNTNTISLNINTTRNNLPASIGLLINKEDVFKVFPYDCWSRYGNPENGEDPHRLYYGHLNTSTRYGTHAEAWYKKSDKSVMGIVVENYEYMPKSTKKEIRAAAQKHGLKIYSRTRTGLYGCKPTTIKEVKNP